ncbi:unnamed protein product, partial [Pocillopora meandrina]
MTLGLAMSFPRMRRDAAMDPEEDDTMELEKTMPQETELNDPSPQFNFGGNSGTIGQQGQNYGTAIGQQHNNRYGRRQFNFGGNSGTIGQQGQNYGTAIGQQHNNRYGRRQFNFGGNSGTIGQQGQNYGTAIGQQHNNRY